MGNVENSYFRAPAQNYDHILRHVDNRIVQRPPTRNQHPPPIGLGRP